MSDTLARICNEKRKHVADQKRCVSEAQLREKIAQVEKPRGFHRALKASKPGLIAEIKKASPSKGVIREDFDVAQIAKAYEKGGAACISVLTDEPYFQGKDEYLGIAKQVVKLPVLRKDFMLDPYQILESRALGADCILLILAALTDQEARELETAAIGLGMDVLAEVHDQEKLTRALQLKTRLIGINNRNLKTLKVDMETTFQLASKIPQEYTVVCESGIETHVDITRVQKAGVNAFLVGESLMRQQDITKATQELIGR